ncbi:SDR family NAD(P)-dependent oxidoreductase [Mycobacterium sp. CBMA271]|uniref:oxidoreductase n=1 Tax=unclassified Mycobacteroides TaxID=2618759 RepID=UPI0012DCF27F|nr:MULTISPECIES: oxidoreductase [unclassified Mycobacteroides]MUM17761.1 short-chain dehydrogenase [Mycobacteroides sp. CBMA 326]MUM22964.1 SDR family NAD(P)-dependent oxidoreductase [Mycobacteroides sp. CBMA 271]
MPAPLQIRHFRESDVPDQTGKTHVITGANNGLGLVAAEALARAGARVVLACRNQDTGRAALNKVRSLGPNADHALVELDLTSLASVRSAAEAIRTQAPKIDVLLNNAGLMAIPLRRTAEGFETQIGVNHLGHFVLTDALLPSLLAADAPRVISLGSIAHAQGRNNLDVDDLNFNRRPYNRLTAYRASKLACMLFGSELARKAAAASSALLSVNVHPGVAATNLFDSMIPNLPGVQKAFYFGMGLVLQDERQGAEGELYAATMPDVQPDDYLGPTQLQGMRGPVRRAPRNREARDPQLAAQLWEKSVELTGADYSALTGKA